MKQLVASANSTRKIGPAINQKSPCSSRTKQRSIRCKTWGTTSIMRAASSTWWLDIRWVDSKIMLEYEASPVQTFQVEWKPWKRWGHGALIYAKASRSPGQIIFGSVKKIKKPQREMSMGPRVWGSGPSRLLLMVCVETSVGFNSLAAIYMMNNTNSILSTLFELYM